MPKLNIRDRARRDYTPEDKLADALEYVNRGLWIMLCNGKVPVTKDWPTKRLPLNELKRRMRKDNSLNIALVLNQSPYIDVECDDPEAEAKLKEWFGGKSPRTPTYASKRGKHRFFRRPEGLPETAKVELDGVEVRIGNGKGALSILPPSIHPEDGLPYAWLPGHSLSDIEPAELPPEIVARLVHPKAVSPPSDDPAAPIPEGERNDTLYRLACRLRETLSSNALLSAIQEENRQRCQPPLSETEVSDIVKSALKTSPDDLFADLEFWHTPDDEPYATAKKGRGHWPIRSASFRLLISRRLHESGEPPTESKVNTWADILSARAMFDGEEHTAWLRMAEHEGRYYVDLANDEWQAVEVDGDGWRVVDPPPVRFRRPKGMLPLPIPQSGGTIDDIRRFVNVREADLPLLLAWWTCTFRPVGPYPILKIRGEQGSAKSTTIRVIRSLLDPNSAPARTKPPGERDLAIAMRNSWVCCLDNLSFLGGTESDALCRLSTTGCGFATRKLYTDDEEVIFDAIRPIILAGIEDVGSRSDLLDRCVSIELPTIPEGQRRDERTFWNDFESVRPKIFGLLLDAISSGIRRLPDVKLTSAPRMADFIHWAVAVEESLGFPAGTCEQAYERNRAEAHQTVLEESSVASSVIRLMQERDSEPYEGTATELLNELRALHHLQQEVLRSKDWPKSPRSLSAALSRLAPNLRHAGIEIERGSAGHGNARRNTLIIRASSLLPEMDRKRAHEKKLGAEFRAAYYGTATSPPTHGPLSRKK